MADTVVVKTRQISRDKLAQFLPSLELIKAFENLSEDVSKTLPQVIENSSTSTEEVQGTADAAAATASVAQGLADLALAIAVELSQRPDGLEQLRGEMQAMQARIDELESRPSIDALQAQLEVLRGQFNDINERAPA